MCQIHPGQRWNSIITAEISWKLLPHLFGDFIKKQIFCKFECYFWSIITIKKFIAQNWNSGNLATVLIKHTSKIRLFKKDIYLFSESVLQIKKKLLVLFILHDLPFFLMFSVCIPIPMQEISYNSTLVLAHFCWLWAGYLTSQLFLSPHL